MKYRWTLPESILLSLVGAWGSVGCVATAFDIPVTMELPIMAAWGIWALLCAVLLRHRWGFVLPVLAAAAAIGWAVYQQPLRHALLSLPSVLARAYDSGYGWGIPAFLQIEPTAMDVPLALIGMLLILAVSWAVCRRTGCAASVFFLLLPLTACLVMTDTVPELRCLFALLLVVVLLLLTSSVRQESGPQGSRLCAAAVIPVALTLGLLFFLVPREGYVNTSQALRDSLASFARHIPEKLQGSQVTLLNLGRPRQQVNLASLSAQPKLRIPVAEVTASENGTVYLRTQEYDRYTGLSWVSSANRQETLAGTGEIKGTVTVRMLNAQSSMPVPCYPDGELILVDGAALSEQDVWEYSVACRQQLLGPVPGEEWLALPEETERRAREILNALPLGNGSTEEIACAVGDYVQQCAVYDRETRAMPGGCSDFAVWFLEEAERGYCVHFATAAAVLLRAAGIPARYVTGYRADNVGQEPVQVTSDDAHAWVEYYNYRTWTWSILEATPGELVPEPEETEAKEQEAPEQPEIRPTAQTRPDPTDAPVQTERAPTETPAPSGTAWQVPWELLAGILAVVCAAALMEGQRILRIGLRNRRQNRGTANEQAAARWQELLLHFRLLGISAPEELRALTEKAVFSQHTLTEEELDRFIQCAAASRKALRCKSWYRRLLYRYWYAVI